MIWQKAGPAPQETPAPRPTVRVGPETNTAIVNVQAFGRAQREIIHAASATATNLMEQHLALGRRGLIVCAPSSAAGSSFVAANVALALSQANVSTLVVDCNLDAPALERYFPCAEPPVGLRQFLEASTDEDIIFRDIAPKLSVVHAGGAGLNEELIVGPRLEAFVEASLRDYNCTIIDTPPANRSPVALHIGSLVGYALVVARRQVSFMDDVSFLVKQLEQEEVTVIGAVLTGT